MVMRSPAAFVFAFLMLLALSADAWCAEKTPVIEFISPGEGETVRGEITVAATVTPESVVEVVDFYIQEPGGKDRYSWKEYGPSPYVWGGKGQKLDTRLFPDGPASAVLFCYTGGRKPAAEKRVHFIIDNGRPKVRIISPADLSTVDETFSVRVDVSDLREKRGTGNIAAVSVSVDGAMVKRITEPPFEAKVDACLISPGLHSIRVVAEDGDGLTGSDGVMVSRQAGSAILGGRPR